VVDAIRSGLKDAFISKMMFSPWRATMRRMLKLRPSRTRVTS
jgi:hypothetical protein